MTPQSQFMMVAPIDPHRESDLRKLLATMNSESGMADPANAVVPFGQFARLHFARLAVLDDPTLGDIEAHGIPRPSLPVYLAFVGSCDGPASECMADLAQRTGTGLRQIFMHCNGLTRRATCYPGCERINVNLLPITSIGSVARCGKLRRKAHYDVLWPRKCRARRSYRPRKPSNYGAS